jgi:hypothetical protein
MRVDVMKWYRRGEIISFVAEGVDGVDLGGATRGEGAGEQGGDG